MVDEGKEGSRTHGSIPAMDLSILIALESLGVGWLKIFSARRLYLDDTAVLRAKAHRWCGRFASVERRTSGRVHCGLCFLGAGGQQRACRRQLDCMLMCRG